MNAQIALPPFDAPPVSGVESTPRRDHVTLVTVKANDIEPRNDAIKSAIVVSNHATWTPTTTHSSAKSFIHRKVALFAAVAGLHVAAAWVISQMQPVTHKTSDEPLQVVMIANVQQEQITIPLPKIPALTPVAITLPQEPVIDIAEPVPTAITVVPPTTSTPEAMSTAATPKLVSAVEYVRAPMVKYPSAARALKQRGTVMLRVLIDTSGNPRDVQIQQSSGYRLLDEAAMSAVLKALFKPKTENGNPVSVYAIVPIEFTAS